MGINTFLVSKLGEDKTAKLKAIFGGLFIYILGNFPIATMVDGLNWNPVYGGYIMLIWSAAVIALTSLIILFFGKSDQFPLPAPSPLKQVAEEVVEEFKEVVAEAEDVVETIVEAVEEAVETPAEEPTEEASE